MAGEPDNGFADWGGYMNAKITKLEEQFAQSSDFLRQSNLFTGISIFVNGLTNPSADELKRIMMVHGGVFHHYERSHTTYIIASNLPDVKIRNMNTSKIIKPDWVVDCLKENRILDYTKYLLYTNQKPSQPKIQFKKNEKPSLKVDHPPNKLKPDDAEVYNIMKELNELNSKIQESTQKPVSNNISPEIFDQDEEHKEVLPGQAQNLSESNANQTRYAKSAVDPNFLSEFYNNSRLHHIATLGAGFKQYVSELREKHTGLFPLRKEVLKKLTRNEASKSFPPTIMHIDMDCFFVSVGLRSRPHLRGEPVAVTHSKGGSEPIARPGSDRQKERELYMKKFDKANNSVKSEKVRSGFDGTESLSEIASCSYEARKMGVRNGMFVGQALKLCPQLKTIPYDFEAYKEVAYTLYNTVAQYTLNIEAVSCDEMFVDLVDVLNDLKVESMDFVGYVRNEVKSKTGCPCSAGVGGNRLQARMATKKAKPDGQFFLSPDNVEEYMANIPIDDLPGVGYSTAYTLEQMKLKTCGDLQKIPLSKLQQEIGKKFGETIYQFCRGIDNRPLVYGQIRKSISAEVNYGIRFTEPEELEKFLRQLCKEVHSRLMSIKRRGKCITLKLMIRAKEAPVETSKFMGHGYCDNLTKSTTLQDYTCDLDIITKTILNTMKSLNIPPKELRGIGIHIAKLDNPEDNKVKRENVLKAMFEKVVEKQKDTSEVELQRPETKTPTKSLPEKHKTSPTTPENKTTKAIKRGRGRPAKTSKTSNITNMLQNAAKKQNNEKISSDIDYNVLAELPEELRDEILREHKRYAALHNSKPINETTVASNEKSDPPISNVDQEFLEALPPEIRSEIEKDIARQQNAIKSNKYNDNRKENPLPKQNTVVSSNIFDQPNCRQLIDDWLESSDYPEECDIDIISQNAQELVQSRRITDLYVPLRMLYRLCSAKSNCAWHAGYRTIISVVQREMIASYGSGLMINEHVKCNDCLGCQD